MKNKKEENFDIRPYLELSDAEKKKAYEMRKNLETKTTEDLKQNYEKFRPKKFLDSLIYKFNTERRIKYAITGKVLFERQILASRPSHSDTRSYPLQEPAEI